MKSGLGKRKICAVCTGVELGSHTDFLSLSPFPPRELVLQVLLWWPHLTGMAQMSPLPNMFADGLSQAGPSPTLDPCTHLCSSYRRLVLCVCAFRRTIVTSVGL